MSEFPLLLLGCSGGSKIEGKVGRRVRTGGGRNGSLLVDEGGFTGMLKEELERGGVQLKLFTIADEDRLRE